MPEDRDINVEETDVDVTDVDVEVEGTEPGARSQRGTTRSAPAESPEAERTAKTVEKGVETAAAGARAFSEAVERERLDEEAKRAIREGGDAARQVQSEINRQWENREGPVGRMREQVERLGQESKKEAQRLRSDLQSQFQEERGRVQRQWEQEQGFPGAVHRSYDRAQEAPRRISHEVRDAWSDIKSDMVQMLTAGSLTLVVGTLALLAFTWWLGIALSELVGFPLGVLITALIYGVVAAITMAWARGAARDMGQETREAAVETRQEFRRVTEPVMRAQPEAQQFVQHERQQAMQATQQVARSGQRVAQAAGAPAVAERIGQATSQEGQQQQQVRNIEQMTPADLVGRTVYDPNGNRVGTVTYAQIHNGRVEELQVRPRHERTRRELGNEVAVPVTAFAEHGDRLTIDRSLDQF